MHQEGKKCWSKAPAPHNCFAMLLLRARSYCGGLPRTGVVGLDACEVSTPTRLPHALLVAGPALEFPASQLHESRHSTQGATQPFKCNKGLGDASLFSPHNRVTAQKTTILNSLIPQLTLMKLITTALYLCSCMSYSCVV